MDHQKSGLIALTSIPLIMTLGNSMLLPVLPQIGRELHVSSFEVSMLITVYGVVAIFFIPVAGYLSDRFGRKKIIIPSLLLTGLGGAIAGIAGWFGEGRGVYWIILAGRLLQGIGASGAFPIVLPLVGDMFQSDIEVSRSLGIIETANTFGKVVSPLLGALLAVYQWYLPFLSIPVLCLVSLVLVALLIQPPVRENRAPEFVAFTQSVAKIFKNNGRWLYAVFGTGCVCMFAIFGVLFYLSERLETQHITGLTKGLMLAIPLAVLCLSSYFTGQKIGQNKVAMKWCGVIGMIVATLSLIGVAFMNGNYLLIAGLIPCKAAIGMVLPSMDALITEGIAKAQRGTITSFYSSMRFIGVSLGPPVISLMLGADPKVVFMIIAGVTAGNTILIWLAIQPDVV